MFNKFPFLFFCVTAFFFLLQKRVISWFARVSTCGVVMKIFQRLGSEIVTFFVDKLTTNERNIKFYIFVINLISTIVSSTSHLIWENEGSTPIKIFELKSKKSGVWKCKKNKKFQNYSYILFNLRCSISFYHPKTAAFLQLLYLIKHIKNRIKSGIDTSLIQMWKQKEFISCGSTPGGQIPHTYSRIYLNMTSWTKRHNQYCSSQLASGLISQVTHLIQTETEKLRT